MTRPKQEGAARTHIRVSDKVKRRLDELKVKSNFTTISQMLDYYFSSDTDYMIKRYISLTPETINNYVKQTQPTAEVIYNYTKQQPDIDKMIKETSSQLMRVINKDKQKQSKGKEGPRSLWRKRQRYKHRLPRHQLLKKRGHW